jgi:hypothetical protein
MKDKIISLGVNNNPTYLFYIPLVKWCWEQFGWGNFVFFVGEQTECSRMVEKIIDDYDYYLKTDGSFKTETIAQVSRLYAAWELQDSLIMTSDCDIIPLSNYWTPNKHKITCYGRDLSDEHFPICYLCMDSTSWQEVMKADHYEIELDINNDIHMYAHKAKNIWTLDQDMITERLNQFSGKILIDRGVDKRTGYPIGRVDRSQWTLDHKQYIDAHLPHDILTNEASFKKVMELLHIIWPSEDFKWFVNYYKEFKKLL